MKHPDYKHISHHTFHEWQTNRWKIFRNTNWRQDKPRLVGGFVPTHFKNMQPSNWIPWNPNFRGQPWHTKQTARPHHPGTKPGKTIDWGAGSFQGCQLERHLRRLYNGHDKKRGMKLEPIFKRTSCQKLQTCFDWPNKSQVKNFKDMLTCFQSWGKVAIFLGRNIDLEMKWIE